MILAYTRDWSGKHPCLSTPVPPAWPARMTGTQAPSPASVPLRDAKNAGECELNEGNLHHAGGTGVAGEGARVPVYNPFASNIAAKTSSSAGLNKLTACTL